MSPTELALAPIWAWLAIGEMPSRYVLVGGAIIVTAITYQALSGASAAAATDGMSAPAHAVVADRAGAGADLVWPAVGEVPSGYTLVGGAIIVTAITSEACPACAEPARCRRCARAGYPSRRGDGFPP